MINWDDIRKQFPVTENSTYLNAAAAGPLSRATMAAATQYYQQMMNDADTHWDEWLRKREEVRRKVAAFINAEPDEIALTTNTSSGMNVIVDALEKLAAGRGAKVMLFHVVESGGALVMGEELRDQEALADQAQTTGSTVSTPKGDRVGQPAADPGKRFTVVIEPGHGGIDGGASVGCGGVRV